MEMGIESFFLFSWAVQALLILVVAWSAAVTRHCFGALGVVLGAVIGISPYFVIRGPGSVAWATFIAASSAIALSLVCLAFGRWKAFATILLLLTIPLVYLLFGYKSYPPSSHALLRLLGTVGEVASLLGPILCALASGAMLTQLDRLFIRRSA
jgi:hypothetical protein